MKRKILNISIIFGILIFAIVLRTYRLHAPLGDWHSWRQADTASVAWEYVQAGHVDLFHPRFHDVSSIPSGLDNPEGWRMVEFPLRDGLHAQLYFWFPQLGFLEWGRIISIFCSVATILLLYLIVLDISGFTAASFTALTFAILPYNIFYGRVILPEPMLVFFAILTLYTYMRHIQTGKIIWWLFTLLSLTFALLLKPTALTILLPMWGYAYAKHHLSLGNFFYFLSLPILAIVPYFLWRRHIAAYPAGIPASSWLFNSNGIRFKGAWFRWLFGERIGKLILGYWGLVPLAFGVLKLGQKKTETLVYGGFVLGSLAYLAIIATGNVQHDYYQIQIMPTISILVGVGCSYIFVLKRGWHKLFASFFILGILALSLALSWYEIRGYFWINNQAMVEAGLRLNALTPTDALVIAPYQGDTAFLFQTKRRGWPIGGDIEDKIKKGADYYITTTRDTEYNLLKTKYTLIEETEKYSIIKLMD